MLTQLIHPLRQALRCLTCIRLGQAKTFQIHKTANALGPGPRIPPGHIAAHAAERHRALQRRLVALIEPVSILFIGLVIGFIMVGVVLAMTSLTDVKL